MLNKKTSLKQLWSETRWILLGILWLAGLALGYIGFSEYSRENSLGWSFLSISYRTLQLSILESGSVDGKITWMLNIARFLLPVLTAYTALQALMHIFREQTQWLRLWRMRNHVVICGLGSKSRYLISELLTLRHKVVIIDQDSVRQSVNDLQRQGAIILHGSATNRNTLLSARIHRASHVVCFLEEDHLNLQIALQAYQIARANPINSQTCIIHISSPSLLTLIKHSELTSDSNTLFQLETFNPYAEAARQLLHEDPDWQETTYTPDHILVIGLGGLGENLIIEAAMNWHIQKHNGKLQITVMDNEANRKIKLLLEKYPDLSAASHINSVQTDFNTPELLPEIFENINISKNIQRVYLCLSNPVISMQICLQMLSIPVFRNTPIRMRMEKEGGLYSFIERAVGEKYCSQQVIPFDLYERTCSASLVMSGSHERLARALHEQYCALLKVSNDRNSSCLPWDQLTHTQKKDNRQQANRIFHLLNTIGYGIYPIQNWDAGDHIFTPDEIEQMAQKEHELWCQAKIANGYRHGSEKNEKNRTHPDLVPWAQLQESEKEKNRAPVREIPRLLAQLGYEVGKMMQNTSNTEV